MSFKEIISDPASWLTTGLAIVGGAFGYKKIFAETKNITVDSESKKLENEIKKDKYNNEKLDDLNRKLEIILLERDELRAAKALFEERTRNQDIRIQELLAELNLYKTIFTGKN